jgi:hypothetical protein
MTSVVKTPACESGQREPANGAPGAPAVPDAVEAPRGAEQKKKVKKRVGRRPKSLPPSPRGPPPDVAGDLGTLGPRIKSSASLQTPIKHYFLSKDPAPAARKPLEEKGNNQQPVEPK